MSISDDQVAAANTFAASFAPKVQTAIKTAEARHPDSVAVRVLHDQFNTVAIFVEDLLGQTRGTYGGVDGTVHPDTGGTGDKGGGGDNGGG